MTESVTRVFEKLSGWCEKSRYEREHGGYITIEEDVMDGEANAFLWTMNDDDDSHVDHLQYMHLGGRTFVKR